MVLKFNKKLLLSLLLFAVTTFAFALEVPSLRGRINDNADVIDSKDEAALESHLERLEEQTGIQIAVLTVPSLEGDSIESFSLNVAREWGLGQEGKNNGALFVLGLAEHDVRIEVGYGLEGTLTDATCGIILRNIVIPEFKNGDYSEGILQGVSNMVGIVLEDEELIDEKAFEEDHTDVIAIIIFLVVWFTIMIITISAKGGLRHVVATSTVINSTRSSSSGFGSSGGFGGFSGGGGSFGGGGASGHW